MKLEMAKFKSQEDEITSLKKQLSDKNIEYVKMQKLVDETNLTLKNESSSFS